MREKVKGFIVGLIVATMLIMTTVSVGATDGSMDITAVFKNIKIYVDGDKLNPTDANGNTVEPFIYNGTTYLPVRAIGEALGKQVTWDNNTNSVYLGEIVNTQTTQNTQTYSRTNPAPINTPQSINISNYLEEYTATVTVLEVIGGDNAWKKIQDANMFNGAPSDGKKYVLVKVQAIISAVKDDKAVDLNNYLFKTFSSSNVEYSDWISVVEPSPQFSGQVYSGGVLEGYITFEVGKDDISPKIVFGQNYDGTGGIWFSIK